MCEIKKILQNKMRWMPKTKGQRSRSVMVWEVCVACHPCMAGNNNDPFILHAAGIVYK